jgi:hypothetical protein
MTLLNLKIYFRATVIEEVWSRHKERRIHQWNRKESPEVNPNINGRLIFNRCQAYPAVKALSPPQMVLRNWVATQKNEVGPLSYTRHKSKFSKTCNCKSPSKNPSRIHGWNSGSWVWQATVLPLSYSPSTWF